MKVWISGAGLTAPGVADWEQAQAIFAGRRKLEVEEYRYRAPAILSGAERRRCPASVKLALDVAEQARLAAGVAGSDLSAVFGSMSGDASIIVRSLSALAEDPQYLSPTDFHNSVHNAAVGYWAIATGSRHGATSLTAAEETLAAAILKASMQALSGEVPVLLCVYDVPFPPPLNRHTAISAPFGAALVLNGQRPANCMAALEIELRDEVSQPDRPAMDGWSELFDTNPAARIVPIAERLAVLQAGDEFVLGIGAVGTRMLTARVSL